ncbi:glycosyltransferase family 1 protein, partial [bacterium]|nr:glycosyltransferase family 1 protein [bacterium]
SSDIQDVLRVSPEIITVVPGAADEFSSGQIGELPEWLYGRRYAFSMGNTRPHKDLPTLLRAFAALADESLSLVLAGDDPGGYASLILGNDPAVSRIRFTGPITDDTLRALYASAKLFVFPSLYEGFGLPPLEAMSFGTPVIAARAASLPEVVGDAGLYFEPGDASELSSLMGTVLADPKLRAELAERGKARAGTFTWADAARRMAEVYRSAV